MSNRMKWWAGGALALAWLLTGSSPVSAAEDDAALRGRIQSDLQRALEDDADVTVEVADGHATLTGMALTVHASREAERRAAKLADEVDNRIQVVPEQAIGDQQLWNDVASTIMREPYYGVFDSVELGVQDGVVTLKGSVNQPYRRDSIEKRVAKVAGVTAIQNEIRVQPVSLNDDSLRWQLVNAIYGDPRFEQYRHLANPPIRIVVERGHVTLTGVVASRVEQQVLGHIARGVLAFSVDNRLEVEGDRDVERGRTSS